MVYCLVFRCGEAGCGIKRKLRIDILLLNAEKVRPAVVCRQKTNNINGGGMMIAKMAHYV